MVLAAQFAKEQLVLLTREWHMHPNGQFPAYEWACGDVNPPVHAWATWRVFQIDRQQNGDTGRGVGASHQTGWTGLVAKLIQPRAADHTAAPFPFLHHPEKDSGAATKS